MKKITFSSRYYEPLSVILIQLNFYSNNLKTLYDKDYDETSNSFILYKNEVNPIELSNIVYDKVNNYLNENLFTKNEIILLLENLLPSIDEFGKSAINLIECRINQNSEYKKTIDCIEQTRNLLKGKFNNLYYELINKNQIKPTPEPTTAKESKLDLTERMLILRYLQQHNLFPKHNSKIAQYQKDFDGVVSVLLNENIESIKKARGKTDIFFNPKEITIGQKPFKIANLNNIKPYFLIMDKQEIVKEIEKLIDFIDRIDS